MYLQRYLTQPSGGAYRSLILDCAAAGGFSRMDGALAYATSRGVESLSQGLGPVWVAWRKRWLIGIDWCRSEPSALERLASLDRSEVRIHAGRTLVQREACTPDVPFHPKTYVLRGPDRIAVICGSGNLSANGLTKGHEVGSVVFTTRGGGETERRLSREARVVSLWFDSLWNLGAPLTTHLLRAYAKRYEAILKAPSPLDDDTETPMTGRRRLDGRDLLRLRAANSLWIEAGNLHENRGPGRPGNQLMLSPMTRVFFGFPATDLAPDTTIGTVLIEYEGHEVDRSLRFSNNSMDVLGLPVPGVDGPVAYDRRVLRFTRSVSRGRTTFKLTLASPAERRGWRERSQRSGVLFTMTSGRQWGIY